MSKRPYELVSTSEGMVARVRLRGRSVLSIPLLNRGTAFTLDEREALGLTGLLPEGVSNIETQLHRVYAQYLRQPDDLAKNLFLGGVRDRNEVLFYRLLVEDLEEMLPIVYTPTVGTAIERYSLEFGRPRGVYLSVNHPDQVETALLNYGLGPDDVDLIVATDSEGILGIGDWGRRHRHRDREARPLHCGGLELCTPRRGHPRRPGHRKPTTRLCWPRRCTLGNRHPRVRGERYDELIDAYVKTATRLFPQAMLHWEDFGAANARRILLKYADTCCTFNDEHAGHGRRGGRRPRWASGPGRRGAGCAIRPWCASTGAGTAGIGIADALRQVMIDDGLSAADAATRFYAIDRLGLLTTDYGRASSATSRSPYLREAAEVSAPGLRRGADGTIGLAEVVTCRLGRRCSSGPPPSLGAFSEAIVTEMAAPTWTGRSSCRCPTRPARIAEARPADLIAWTQGRALIATVQPARAGFTYGHRQYEIAQANNALIFPGLGIGVTVCRPGARQRRDARRRGARPGST